MDHDSGINVKSVYDGRNFVTTKLPQERDERVLEWDGEEVPKVQEPGAMEDIRTMGQKRPGSETKTVEWKPEPALEARQYALFQDLSIARTR